MEYNKIVEGIFLERPNRFIAYVLINGKQETVHVKNTGRCKELLVPGATVFLEESDNPNRKTKYDLVKIIKENRIINMDSQAPNKVVGEWLSENNLYKNTTLIKAEKTYEKSRFDFYIEGDGRKAFIEVKGVTLEDNGVVRFPDAPSDRAVKHIEHLIKASKDGYDTYVMFVIQMKNVKYFEPNTKTHPKFAEILKKANDEGVNILAYECNVTKTGMNIEKPVKVVLTKTVN